tara:strand:- start:1378 stop:1563 length:186 start_codon:yes stop_codon:yes gene_type:complete
MVARWFLVPKVEVRALIGLLNKNNMDKQLILELLSDIKSNAGDKHMVEVLTNIVIGEVTVG